MSATFAEHILPNGLRVVCEVMPRVRSAAAAFLARTGSRHERPVEHGVSHFLEHMCFKGTARRSSRDINIRFDELGSIYNAYTSKEHTVYYGWVPAGRLGEQIELLADMLRPSLPPDEFETERHVILEEIAMNEDSFDRQLWNFVHETAFGAHPLGHEVLGEKETIAGLAREPMMASPRRRYAADNVCLVAAGAVEPEAVFAFAGRACGTWQRAADGVPAAVPAAAVDGVRKRTLARFKRQSVVLVYPSIPRGHADEDSVEAFTALFGGHNSRCYWNIVQKGICTEAGAVWIAYENCGLLAFYADGEPERCEDMLAALRAEIRAVSERGVGADEVQRVKNQRRTQLALEAESPRTRVMQLVDDLETHDCVRTAQARLAAVEAVSVQTIARYLEQYPIDGDGLLLSCGPRDWP
jgi:predicted Zn-dependent peptidase